MKYESPKIIEETTIEIYQQFLKGSVVTKDSEVESVGQEIETHDMSGEFSSKWE